MKTPRDNVYELYTELVGEVGEAFRRAARRGPYDTNDETAQRAYVRSVFAAIEGHVFQMKQYALADHRRRDLGFTDAEVVLLAEKTYRLNDKGEAESHTRFIRLPQNLRFAFRAFARANDVDFILDVSGPGWAAFKEALKIRNRLTHPKIVDDLYVTEDDVKTVAAAYSWFQEASNAIFHLARKGS